MSSRPWSLGRAGLAPQSDVRISGCVCSAMRSHGCQLWVANRRLRELAAECSVGSWRAALATQRGTLGNDLASGAWRQHKRQPHGTRIRASASSRVEQLLRPFGRVVSSRPAKFASTVLRRPPANNVTASCGVRADAFADQPLGQAPRRFRAGRRVNITWCAIRRACTLHSAATRATTTGLQLSATCGIPLAAVGLTPVGQADVATLREVLRGRSRRCARREHSRLL